MMTAENRDWQALCAAASKEPNSERLMVLVSELIEALDDRRHLRTSSGSVESTTW